VEGNALLTFIYKPILKNGLYKKNVILLYQIYESFIHSPLSQKR